MVTSAAGVKSVPAKKTLVLVSHTHWDREWYLPFQQFRFKLVRLIDRLLDLLERDPYYAYFMLDGQTVVLEDYLEIRPEREVELKYQISSGRILVGPWYILADQFLVSGEAHIQNLLKGFKVASRFGEPMKVGYIPDPFGHISQMPQILQGFEINSAVFWRGVGPKVNQMEFVWEAPDGSAVEAIHLANGYNTGLAFNAGPDAALRQIERVRPFLIDKAASGYVLLLNGDDHVEPSPSLPDTIRAVKEKLAEEDQPFELIHSTLPQFLKMVRATGVFDQPQTPHYRGEFRDSQLAYLLPGVLSSRMWIKQWNGRLENMLEREAGPLLAWGWSLPATLPSPEYDPASLAGHYAAAWKYLLQNQPHDSICGCSTDQVHIEMKTRFAWVEQTASNLVKEGQRRISQNVNTAQVVKLIKCGEKAVPLVIFNPLPFQRTEIAVAPLVTKETFEDFVILDSDGTVLPHYVAKQKRELLFTMDIPASSLQGMAAQGGDEGRIMDYTMGDIKFNLLDQQPEVVEVDILAVYQSATPTDPNLMFDTYEKVDKLIDKGVETFRVKVYRQEEAEVAFLARNVPPCGYKTFVVRPREAAEPKEQEIKVEPGNYQQETIENEFYRIWPDPEVGSLNVLDKETGLIFKRINSFRDSGDAGDEYNYCPPASNKIIDNYSGSLLITLSRSRLEQSIVITSNLELPSSLTEDRQGRRPATVLCPVTTTVKLVSGLKRIDFITSFVNRAQDHRLQVLFPAPFAAFASEAEQAFDVVTRPVELPEFDDKWIEDPIPNTAMKSFVSVCDNDRKEGLTLMAQGLPEYEVIPATGDNGAVLALTLLRGVGWLSRDDLKTRRGHAGPGIPTPEAQMLGPHTFQYALMPHRGDWLKASAQQQAQAFNHPLTGTEVLNQSGDLPPETSFLEIAPLNLAYSTTKRSEDGQAVIVRLWNPTGFKVGKAGIKFYRKPVEVRFSNLLEQAHLQEIEPDSEDWYKFQVGKHQIISLRIKF